MAKTRSLYDNAPQQYKSGTHHGKVVPNKAGYDEKRRSHKAKIFIKRPLCRGPFPGSQYLLADHYYFRKFQ